RIVIAGTAIRPPGELHSPLQELETFLASRGLGGLRITGAINDKELLGAVRLLLDYEGDGAPGPEAINARLGERGVEALVFTKVRQERDREAAGGVDDAVLGDMRLYLRGVRAVQRLLERGITPAMELELNRIADGLVAAHSAAPHRLLALATPRQLVPYALRHPMHMAIHSVAIGSRFGLNDTELVELAVCALLVDLGMGAVDPQIQSRTGALSASEMAQLRLHPVHSVQRLLRLPVLSPSLRRRVVVAFEHHLGVDWKGYPAVNRWERLHPYSRIVSVADGYDALRANRPERPGMQPAAALAVLREESGSRYDPIVVVHLEEIVREHLKLRND
ncbi:MAG: HD domain-containing phosphohydrolase, partial [Myxococcota bacterium]|nr:HD domain-containing phosphohydrolase [Myxococcota bacterium]